MNLELLSIGENEDDAIVISNSSLPDDFSNFIDTEGYGEESEGESEEGEEGEGEGSVEMRKRNKKKQWRNLPNCGLVENRIVGGAQATPGQFPWLAALKLRSVGILVTYEYWRKKF